jgi:hypothetical protein
MDIAQQRLLNQRIDGERFARPEEAVRWMGAMQAQAYQEALWAIGLRMQSATVADVEQAIAERKILRTWPMRGTLHFVPPEDAKWMLALLTPRVLAGDKRRQQQLELDDTIIDRAGKLFHAGLAGGRRLTRPEMRKKKGLEILLKPFAASGNVQEEIIEAARRYSDFLGLAFSSLEVKTIRQAL